MTRPVSALILVIASCALVHTADASRSEPLARELASAMQQRQLAAFAAKNPDAPNGYVAVLLFPDVQLLLVAGEPTAPAATQYQLDQKQYMDVYGTLQQAVVAETKVFFQDLKADGIHAKSEAIDVLYERVSNQTIFDGEPVKHHMTDAQYSQRFRAADAQYTRFLSILLESLKGQPTGAAKP